MNYNIIKRETCCGLIFYKRGKNNNFKFLVIKNKKGFWILPKEKKAPSQSHLNCAIKAAKSDLGCDVDISNIIISRKFKTKYYLKRAKILKYMIFYPIEQSYINVNSGNFLSYKWVTCKQLNKLNMFDELKEVIKDVNKYLYFTEEN